MRIAQVAPPFETVPPTRYGGTERVVATLTEALVERGHDVTLFAPGDSRTQARLVPTVPEALWHAEPPLTDMNPFWSITLDTILERIDDFDVVHSHLDYWGFLLAHHSRVPVLTTLHGRLDLAELQPTQGMSRCFARGQTRMNDAYPRAAPFWCERHLQRAGGRRQRCGAEGTPGDHQAGSWIQLYVAPFDSPVAKHEREATTRPWVEFCAVTHPADQRFRSGEVAIHKVKFSVNMDGAAIAVSGHDRFPLLA